MTRPRVFAAIVTWLVIVAGTSTLVWAVISRAGDDLATSEQPPTAATPTDGHRPSSRPSGARRAWQGPAGLIVATCDRRAIRLVSAQPGSGFHVEVRENGPGRLKVEFEAREAGRGGDVTVMARCASGIPTFASQADDDD
jgi:hypothetical protein